jgi:cellulose synthase/poly-beta-1,6-N-acetylglucosamine synthase-like glycosyltransferase
MIEPLTDQFAAALARASSRLAPPATPAISVAIHLTVLFVWVALFALAFGRGGLLAWSIGLLYLAYDAILQLFTAVQTARITDADNTSGLCSDIRLAVLIAAYDEETTLPETLKLLLEQTDPPDEIVIADDGSTDGTAAVLAQRYGLDGGRVRVGATTVSLLRLAHGGKAHALNAALMATSADVVVTVDADTIADPSAVGAVRQAFSREPELVGVTGVITPVCQPTRTGRVLQWFQTYEYIGNFLSRHAWMRLDCLQLISGAFAGFRRRAVVEVGGFDDTCLVEDYELVARMQRYAGEHGLRWRFRVLGGAHARTEAPGSLPAFLRQRRRWFGGFLQTQWWYRAMVGDRRLGNLGTVMLPIKAVDTVQPIYGLTGAALLLVFAATGRTDVVCPALLVIAGKLAIDVVFQVWSLRRYRRWVGDSHRASLSGVAAATVLAPFTFALLLQAGAVLGWAAFLQGGPRWGQRSRFGVRATGT